MFKAAFLCALLSCTAGSVRAQQRIPTPSCPQPSITSQRIIDANLSRAAGAVFISTVRSPPSRTCADVCCAKPDCNLAVYRPDGGSPCYLFNCRSPSVCSFAEHSRYSVAVVTRSPTTPAPLKKVAFLGSCQLGDQCEGVNTECSAGMCMCKENYHHKNDVCRERCDPATAYECVNGGVQYSGPDCIPVYDVCNGIPDCADGSDEIDCAAAILPDAGGTSGHTAATQAPVAFQRPAAPTATAAEHPPAVQPSAAGVLLSKDLQPQQPVPTGAAQEPPHTSTPRRESDSRRGDMSAAGVGSGLSLPAAGQLDAGWATAERGSAIAALVLGSLLSVALVAYAVRRCIIGASRGNLVHRVKAMGWGGKPDADYLINGMYL